MHNKLPRGTWVSFPSEHPMEEKNKLYVLYTKVETCKYVTTSNYKPVWTKNGQNFMHTHATHNQCQLKSQTRWLSHQSRMHHATSDTSASGFEASWELLDLVDDGSPGLTIGDSGLEGTGECSSSTEFSSITGNTFWAHMMSLSSSGSLSSISPSFNETTSCVVNWWKSTISRKKRFSRAYVEFSCASLDFSASNVSSCTRIWFSNG